MFISLLVAASLVASPAPKPVQNASKAVIPIGFHLPDDDGKDVVKGCSAFYVDLVHLVTAAHCIPEDSDHAISGIYNRRTEEPLKIVKVVGDLALLESQPTNVVPLKLGRDAEMGLHLYTFGYAYGSMFVGYQRHIAGLSEGWIVMDGPLSHGMSGGPAVNDKGQVIGVNQASNSEAGFMCPVEEIKGLLGR